MILAEGRLSLLNRKISKLLQPSVQLYFVILILFALASALFSIPLAVLEAVVVLILGLYTRTSGHKRRREITKYIENITGNVDVATKDTMVNSPLPMVIFRPESDDIIWTNDRFLRLTGDREHLFDAKLSSVVPGFDTRWLLEGKNECPDHVSFCGRRFVVYGHLVRCGDVGAGNTTKLANQIIVACNIQALSEALTLAKMAGVDPELVFQAIRGGLAGSTVMNAKAPMMIEGNDKPGFKIDLHIKDLNNALDCAHTVGSPLPMTAAVQEIFQWLHNNGCGQDDHSSIIKYYKKLTGIESL